MTHEMFDNHLYLPSDAREVESIVKTGKVPIPTSREYGRGAVVFGSQKEARNDAFSSGLLGGKNNPEASLARVARVSVRPNNPLIVGGSNPAANRHQYREIADQMMGHMESDEVQSKAEEALRTKTSNNPFSNNIENERALARARALLKPEGRSRIMNTRMTQIVGGQLDEASKTVDQLKLPYDAVGNPSSGAAVAKKSDIIQLKNVQPLR